MFKWCEICMHVGRWESSKFGFFLRQTHRGFMWPQWPKHALHVGHTNCLAKVHNDQICSRERNCRKHNVWNKWKQGSPLPRIRFTPFYSVTHHPSTLHVQCNSYLYSIKHWCVPCSLQFLLYTLSAFDVWYNGVPVAYIITSSFMKLNCSCGC